jgi:hypothetical protein
MKRQLGLCALLAVCIATVGVFDLSYAFANDNQAQNEINLVEGGKSGYSIVIAADASVPVKFAAEELQKYLAQISGARLPVATNAAPDLAICVGEGSIPAAETDKLHADLKDRGEDGYAMCSSGNRLILTGNSPRASLYAVYHFLEKYLGCSWCVPGHDTVPQQATIRLPHFRDAVGPAPFSMRTLVLFPYGDHFMHKCNLPRTDWAAKNRLNWVHPAPNAPDRWELNKSRDVLLPEVKKRGLNLQVGGHSFSTWLPNARYAKDHPDYYGIKADGSRSTASPCLSHPDVAKEMAANIVKWLNKNPEVNAVDLWHNDSMFFCLCPKCTPENARGSTAEAEAAYTKTYVRFVNQVATLVAQRHPKVLVSSLFYGQTTNCPADAEPLNDNVLAGIALYPRPMQRTMRPLETSPQPLDGNLRLQIPAWRKLAKHFYIYEYYTLHHESNTCWEPVKFWSMVGMIHEDMRFFRRIGVDEISSETWCQDDWYPLNMYAYGRIAWNPNLKPEDIVADFCRRYYGKASNPMIAYWNLLEEGLRESWQTTAPADWRDQKRIVEVKNALSLAENKTVRDRILATAAIHELAINK